MTGRMTALFDALAIIDPYLARSARMAYQFEGAGLVWELLMVRLPAAQVAGLRRMVRAANRASQQRLRAVQDVVIAARRRQAPRTVDQR